MAKSEQTWEVEGIFSIKVDAADHSVLLGGYLNNQGRTCTAIVEAVKYMAQQGIRLWMLDAASGFSMTLGGLAFLRQTTSCAFLEYSCTEQLGSIVQQLEQAATATAQRVQPYTKSQLHLQRLVGCEVHHRIQGKKQEWYSIRPIIFRRLRDKGALTLQNCDVCLAQSANQTDTAST